MSPAADHLARRRRVIVVLGLLSTFGPLSLDLYLPALPELADDLAATPSAAQLTLTACLLGLSVGQVIAGPLSDRYGRRRPLMIGLAAYLVASVACAFASSVEVLAGLRLLQGLGGAAGIVLARAVARDLYAGRQLAIVFSQLIVISGLAPVVAPVLGGQLTRLTDWRGIFGCLSAFGLVLLLAGAFGVPETLPADRRTAGGWTVTLRGFRRLLADRFLLGRRWRRGSPARPCLPTSRGPPSCCSGSTGCHRSSSRWCSVPTRWASWRWARWAHGWRGAGQPLGSSSWDWRSIWLDPQRWPGPSCSSLDWPTWSGRCSRWCRPSD